jgi:colanic acid/amylovoran biosynthesis glycosyltransferase
MLGILIPEFPLQTHIFFWREIVALRKIGMPVAILSTRRPAESACRHEFAAEARKETHYVYPPSIGAGLGAMFLNYRGAKALGYLMGLKETPAAQKLRGFGLFLCAADLYAYSKRRGIKHIHVHSCADAAHVAAICNILGGPSYSLTLHGDLPVYGVDHAAKMSRAACITCDGPHLKEQIVKQVGYPADRVLPNWMGLDTERFASPPRTNGQANKLNLATVARLDACKGHRFAIGAVRKAVDQGMDVRYTLAGEGPERKNIEDLIAKLNLRDRVTLLGTRGETEVLELLRNSDAFVLSSVGMGEAGPISLMEAMSCGLPAVCSIIGATPVMLTDGVEGMLVPQEDEEKLAESFVKLARDPALRQSLGAAARGRATAQFDSAATTRRLLDFIQLHTGLKFSNVNS